MTLPHIEPMSPGEAPTEPGWYVVCKSLAPYLNHKDAEARLMAFRSTEIASVSKSSDGSLRYDDGTKLGRIAKRHVFIARIYPDRIAARVKDLSDPAALNGETLCALT